MYDAVTDYVREGYNHALKEKKRHVGFLMILMQRLVVSSTRAIRTTLERRLDALNDGKTLAVERLENFENGSDESFDELYDMDGQELLDELLLSQITAIKHESRHVETLLDAARKCEQAGPDAKAEALLEWIYKLQIEENEPDLKILIFTEFVPTQGMLREFLEARGITVAILNGSMSMEERKQAQDTFRNDVRVLISTDAGGEGLNLQFCHVIVNYDIPWNPMRLEQRIGRVDRIGQPKIVKAINFVFEDSVEYRVREVLEQKLSVIFDEFGIDKTGDVLDSAEAGELFEEMFASAIVDPENIEKSVSDTVTKIQEEVHQLRESSAIYGISEDPDLQAAERLRSHPLPHWVERMTVGYLKSHGGSAEKRRSWWDLTWPDGQEYRKSVFNFKDAERLSDAVLINLENNRVRGLALNLPQVSSGQPIPCANISDIPASVSGLWGLFEIRLQAGAQKESLSLRIPMLRRGYVCVFLNEDGKLFLPTARHIWDAIQAAETKMIGSLDHEDSKNAYAELSDAAVQAGQKLFEFLRQAHLLSVDKEEERGSIVFASRRKAIDRIGLPEVKQFRLNRCNEDEEEWYRELQSARKIVPEIRPLLLMGIKAAGK